jgi:hypothetical protein
MVHGSTVRRKKKTKEIIYRTSDVNLFNTKSSNSYTKTSMLEKSSKLGLIEM